MVFPKTGLRCQGRIALALMVAAVANADPMPKQAEISCIYNSRLDREISEHAGCLSHSNNGNLTIFIARLRELRFDKSGLAVIQAAGAFYYVQRDGRLAQTMAYDNFADPFVAGRARSPANGKIGYIDRRLRMIIPAKYDGAYVFEHGYAVVCMECRLHEDGEHHWYEGGRWACIDPNGHERAPLRVLKKGEMPGAVCRKTR